MKKYFLHAVAVAVLVGALPLAAVAQNVAIVNGQPVPKASLDALAQQYAAAGRQPAAPEQLREELIMRELFTQEAKKQGIERGGEYKKKLDLLMKQMEFVRQGILISQVVENYRAAHPITDADAKAEYDKFVAANNGKEFKARHILVETEDAANKILADLKKGAKFEDIAKKQSKDPGSGANGGDLDWAAPASFVAEFSEAMLKLNKGETTPAPVKSQFGYHVIRVDDIRAAQLPDFEAVKPQILQQLQMKQIEGYQSELRAKAKIE